jgi:hypothetical protein
MKALLEDSLHLPDAFAINTKNLRGFSDSVDVSGYSFPKRMFSMVPSQELY